jgi:hypothetical protein
MTFSDDEIIMDYLRAYECNPARSEPLGALARYLRLQKRYQLAYQISKIAKDIPLPTDQRLFLECSYYHWRCLDEFAVSAYWVGRHRDAILADDKLLMIAPAHEHERIMKNRQFSFDALAKG